MLQIKRNQTNEIIITATELTTIENAFYLFEFINDQNGEKFYSVLDKNTSSTCRFDSFTLIEPTDINFGLDNFFTYNVYQQDNDTNLDPELSSGLVETGRARIYSDSSSGVEYDSDNTSVIYGN